MSEVCRIGPTPFSELVDVLLCLEKDWRLVSPPSVGKWIDTHGAPLKASVDAEPFGFAVEDLTDCDTIQFSR